MKKLEHDYVYNYYANENYIMKSIYKHSKHKDKLICPEGHDIEMIFNSFKTGYRCLICSGKKHYSHEFIFNYYSKEKYIMRSIYKNSHNKDNLTCPMGHDIKMSFHTFSSGIRCGKCFHSNNAGDNHYKWKDDRTRKSRTKYLSFDLYHINILKDDPNYKTYIESFDKAKTKRNNGNNWIKVNFTVDHIFPRVAFVDNNFDKIYGEELCKKIANKRNNLRLITEKTNYSKGGKYNQEEFINWFTNELILELMNI